MNIKTNCRNPVNWPLLSLLISIFGICLGSYLIVPLLPIYFIESVANGGLAWTRAETFSLFGTFLALINISPFFGGLLGDFILGKSITSLFGYGLTMSGLVMLYFFTSKDMLFLALIALALGFGIVKVNLTASLGHFPEELHQKGYEYYYLAVSLGFICGGLFSNPIFNAYSMTGVVIASLSCTIASLCLFFWFFRNETVKSSPTHSEAQVSSVASPRTFLLLAALAIPFFVCANQLTTGLSVFLHQCVNRTMGTWTFPTLWFAAIGSLIMTVFSPWLRKAWRSVGSSSQRIETLKFSAGYLIIGASFASAAVFALMDSGSAPSLLAIPLMLCIHVMCSTSDFHIRPVLFSAATGMISPRYHSLATGVVYCSIGLGGKLAGTLASSVDAVGFSVLFAICACLALLCGGLSFIWWKIAFARKGVETTLSP